MDKSIIPKQIWNYISEIAEHVTDFRFKSDAIFWGTYLEKNY